jgi:hypothetical protein
MNLITPSSGSGLNQNFTVSATTVIAPSDLTGMSLLVTPSGTQNACYVTYSRAAGTIALYDDEASTLNSKSIGSSSALQNSQCAIGYSVVTIVGGTASLTVQIVFKSPQFVGTKQIYVEGSNPAGSSNLLLRGSWAIP